MPNFITMPSRRAARGVAVQAGACVALLLGLAPTPVHAEGGQSWVQKAFGDGAPATNAAYSASSNWGMGFDTGSSSKSDTLARGTPLLDRDAIKKMDASIERYVSIVKAGGWETIPDEAIGLRAGTSHGSVILLRKRLEATGDLGKGSGYSTSSFDYYLSNALRKFQSRHGLEPTGDLVDQSRRDKNGTRTLAALNVDAQSRLTQLRINRSRLRDHASSVGNRYIIVNLPSQQVEAVEDGRVALRHVAVVGKPERASPLLSSRVYEINFNPIWTLPPTVIREDLIPKGRDMARRKESVLEKFGIDAYTDYDGRKLDPTKVNWGGRSVYDYVYRQEPGPENPLGFVKINFENEHSVYMHDTPSQRVFGQFDRAASSGCIRIQGIEKLVAWILEGNKGWTLDRVAAMKRNGETKSIDVRKQPRLKFIYVTAWTSPDGTVNFRRDLYGYDARQGVSKLASAY